jgi:hypothetical protein
MTDYKPSPWGKKTEAEKEIALLAVTEEAKKSYAGRKPQEYGELSGKLLIEDLQKEIDKLGELGRRVPHDLYILFSGGISQIKEVLDELKMDNP